MSTATTLFWWKIVYLIMYIMIWMQSVGLRKLSHTVWGSPTLRTYLGDQILAESYAEALET